MHINEISKKISFGIGMSNRHSFSVSSGMLLSMYNFLI